MSRTGHTTALAMAFAASVLAIGAGRPDRAQAQGTQTFLYSFPKVPATADGTLGGPSSKLIYVGGSFYGEAQIGGTGDDSGFGGIYKLSATGTVSTLYQFTGHANGSAPAGGLTYYNGVFYGITSGNGSTVGGTVFSLTPAGVETTLHAFPKTSTTDGSGPTAPLVIVGGTIYGTTAYGGANNLGTLYSLKPNGKETVLHSFAGTDGSLADGGLVAIGSTLYGTTLNGGNMSSACHLSGTIGCGTVFASDLSGDITTLYAFANTTDGAEPNFGLFDNHGSLYGVTTVGGIHQCGTLYSELPTVGVTTLHAFAGGTTDACTPNGAVSLLGATLYGPAQKPGAGAIYELSPGDNVSLDFQFDTTDGKLPDAALLPQGSLLWGVALTGGAGNAGTVYSLAP